MIKELLEVIKKEEGSKMKDGKHIVYKDHLGYWTIGAKSAKSAFRIFSVHVHNWQGE